MKRLYVVLPYWHRLVDEVVDYRPGGACVRLDSGDFLEVAFDRLVIA